MEPVTVGRATRLETAAERWEVTIISYKDHARICREAAEEMDQLGEKRTRLALERLARKYEQAAAKIGNKDRQQDKRKEKSDGTYQR
jgi:ribosomal protein L44E